MIQIRKHQYIALFYLACAFLYHVIIVSVPLYQTTLWYILWFPAVIGGLCGVMKQGMYIHNLQNTQEV